jgi:hypothetical protein
VLSAKSTGLPSGDRFAVNTHDGRHVIGGSAPAFDLQDSRSGIQDLIEKR